MGTRREIEAEEPSLMRSEDDDGDPESEVSEAEGDDDDGSSRYEQAREQRIKENMERMNKLGLLDLSLKLKPPKKNPPHKKIKTTPQNLSPQRRSSRIMTLTPINYSERRVSDSSNKENKEKKEKKEGEIIIPEGKNPEVYTEEQEKLLGDCETAWELYVDGYDVDGNRIYDPVKGETCHQCRRKTLGEHTYCNRCELLQGQLCGDCLYTRYGENVMEANHNGNWTCPPCRGICNCNLCRKGKGWMPTGNIYSKVLKLGFKSVAHYLIKTRRPELEDWDGEEIAELSADTTLKRRSTRRRKAEDMKV